MFNSRRRLIKNVNLNTKLTYFKKFNFAETAEVKSSENKKQISSEEYTMQKEGFKKLIDFLMGREKYSWDDYLQQLKVTF